MVRPSPSRFGSLIEESRPLQSFLEKIPAMRQAMVTCAVPAFAFSPLNVLPKLALDKLSLSEVEGNAVLSSKDGVSRIIPTGARQNYYAAVLQLLSEGRQLALVPEWIAVALKKHYTVAKQHDEFMMLTADVIELPGGSNKSLRRHVRKARQTTVVEDYDPAKEAEYLALNATWYRQNAGLKFRTYDKTSIDWMIRNWPDVAAGDPTARLIGIRDTRPCN